MTTARIAVLASGGGTNLQALLDHLRALGERRAGDVVLVASDRTEAGALDRARHAGIHTATVPPTRLAHRQAMDDLLTAHDVDLVVLAGYMRYVPDSVTRRFVGRMLNVHPALLPAFGGVGMYGPRVHRAVLAAGATTTGPTVHFVDDIYDHGAVIAQWPVPVRLDDDEHTLAARVLRAEHILYPRVVQAVAAGEVRLGPDGHIEHPFVLDAASLPALDEELGHGAGQ
ncbi:MAG: phosphoribosylglycinamide formyltransferase [Gemmatimonadota bacterium]|nr:phosphoribosylglycinamide formyltransferase [Gemmatimonadota bacterium]